MHMTDRPTEVEKADAVMRLVDEIQAAHQAIARAAGVLRERRESGQSGASGPLFPYVGNTVGHHFETARAALWAAEKAVAPQFLSATRAIAKDG